MPILVALLAATAPLPAAGAWSTALDSDGMCVLSRPFGDGAVTLNFRTIPYFAGVDVAVVGSEAVLPTGLAPEGHQQRPFGWAGQGWGARLVIEGTAPGEWAPFSGLPLPGERRIVRFSMAKADLSALAKVNTIAVEIRNGRTVSFASTANGAAVRALNDCLAALARRWGVDPATMPVPASPPVAGSSPASWIGARDYPAEARRRRESGISTALFQVDVRGRVTDCRVVHGSGSAALDRATCQALEANGRFSPATDASGAPVRAWASQRIVWGGV